MFTRRFFCILVACIALSIIAVAWPPLLWVARCLAVLLAIATIADACATFIASRRIMAKRSINTELSLNQPNNVTVDIQMRMSPGLSKWFSVTSWDMTPIRFRVSGEKEMVGSGEFSYQAIPTQRGIHEFGVVRSFVRSKLGLFECRRFTDCDTSVKVYPTFKHLERIEKEAIYNTQQGQQQIRRAGNNTEFEQIRAYVPGDDVRTINWKATARSASLMVNAYTDERSKWIVPIVCAGPAMLVEHDGITLLDRAVSAAIALASSAVRHYDEAGLITVTHRGIQTFMRPERGSATVAKMLQRTYCFGLPPTDSELQYIADPDVLPDGISSDELISIRERMDACEADPDYDALASYVITRIQRKSMILLFANFGNITVAKHALPALERISRKHKLVVVLFKNDGIEETAANYDNNEKQQPLSMLRLRALCNDYIEQQRTLAEYLRQHHINVILTSPEKLSTAAIQEYLEIKNRALI